MFRIGHGPCGFARQACAGQLQPPRRAGFHAHGGGGDDRWPMRRLPRGAGRARGHSFFEGPWGGDPFEKYGGVPDWALTIPVQEGSPRGQVRQLVSQELPRAQQQASPQRKPSAPTHRRRAPRRSCRRHRTLGPGYRNRQDIDLRRASARGEVSRLRPDEFGGDRREAQRVTSARGPARESRRRPSRWRPSGETEQVS